MNIEWSRVRHHAARLVLRTLPLGGAPELFDLVAELRRKESDLDHKVTAAIDSLKQSSDLVAELERGVEERAGRLVKLRAEYQRYKQLAAVEQGHAQALIDELQLAVGSGQRRERYYALGINLVAGVMIFLFGVWAQPYLSSIMHSTDDVLVVNQEAASPHLREREVDELDMGTVEADSGA